MSWNVYFKCENTPEAIKASALEKRKETLSKSNSWRDIEPESLEQFEIAIDIATTIAVDARVVGAAKTVHVSLSGQANPGHKPRKGWAGDGITVQVANGDEA